MLNDGDKCLIASAVGTDCIFSDYERADDPFLFEDAYPEYILGAIADYEAEELLFTEEELLQCITDILEFGKRYRAKEFADMPSYFHGFVGRFFNRPGTVAPASGGVIQNHNGILENDTLTMIPVYSNDGGVTASIMAYTAINRNTKRPEDAFFVVDYLLSRGAEEYSELNMWFTGNDCGVPVHEDIMQEDYPFGAYEHWYMSDENYAAFCAVRDQITHARFQGGLDIYLDELFWSCMTPYKNGESIDELVAETYANMERVLHE